MIENKNILITGATGFIGYNLVKELSLNNQIYCIIRPSSNIEPLKLLSNVKFINYDGEIDNLKGQLINNSIDICYHLASLFISEHNNHQQIENLINSNVLFPTHLLDILCEIGVKKFINVGTSWQNYINEKYNPVCLYAATKQSFEDIIEYYYQAKDLSIITLRLYDTYGPNDMRNKLFNLLDKLRISKDSLDMSQGEQSLSLVYITDVIDALEIVGNILINGNTKLNNIYGLYSNQCNTLKEIVHKYEEIYKCKLNINWGKRNYRVREVMHPVFADPSVPNWSPKVDLVTGINLLKHNSLS